MNRKLKCTIVHFHERLLSNTENNFSYLQCIITVVTLNESRKTLQKGDNILIHSSFILVKIINLVDVLLYVK